MDEVATFEACKPFYQSVPRSRRNFQDRDTPLIEAARLGHDKVATTLLIAHADPSIKNNEGKPALMLAAEGRHDETARVLTKAGAGK